jgi:hypothetical protein
LLGLDCDGQIATRSPTDIRPVPFVVGDAVVFFCEQRGDAYAAYYTSMYLLQDTGEAIWTHMKSDFSKDPMQAYIEFWGVMQAIFIQQDAICELHLAVVETKLDTNRLQYWNEIRDKRNLCSGHPSKQSHGRPAPQRAFMGRGFGKYGGIKYEVWDAHTRTRTHPRFNLRALIGAYEAEAEKILLDILTIAKQRWPLGVTLAT